MSLRTSFYPKNYGDCNDSSIHLDVRLPGFGIDFGNYFYGPDIEARIYAFILYKENSAIQVCLVLHTYLSHVVEISVFFGYFLNIFKTLD